MDDYYLSVIHEAEIAADQACQHALDFDYCFAVESDRRTQEARDNLMLHARAAGTMANAVRHKDFTIYAFLSVFHPELSHERKREFIAHTNV